MALATKPKPQPGHKKRVAAHHRQTKHYVKSYWPYLPMLAVVAVGIFVNSFLSRPSFVLGVNSNLTQQALLTSTNHERNISDRQSLSLNDELTQAAQAKAEDMAAKDYWSHTSPDGSSPWDFVTRAGYQYQAAGENLGFGFDSAQTITGAWMHSTEHRDNILDSNFTQVGFGVAEAAQFQGSGPETIVVALYAQPTTTASESAPLTITPVSNVSVSRMNTLADSAASGFIVGILGAAAVMIVALRHAIAWRRLINRGELFVIQHPTFDISLVVIATTAVVLSQTVGFIR